MSFRKMTGMTAGINPDKDFHATSLCMKYVLHNKFKQTCRGIPGMSPNEAGALLLFQVSNLFISQII